jgi:uncharacterized protein
VGEFVRAGTLPDIPSYHLQRKRPGNAARLLARAFLFGAISGTVDNTPHNHWTRDRMSFLIVFFSAYYAAHSFAWWRTSLQLKPRASLRRFGYLLALLPTSAPVVAHLLPATWPSWMLWAAFQAAFLWFGLFFYFVLFQLGAILLDLTSRLLNRGSVSKTRAGFAACAILTMAVGTYGIYEASLPPGVVTYTIESPKIERGFRIVHLSDIHLGAQVRPERIHRLRRMVEDLRPDLLLDTGDLLSDSIPLLGEHSRMLGFLEPAVGSFGVMGNHEFYVGWQRSVRFFEQTGIRLLRNEVHHIPELNVALVGVDDPAMVHFRDGANYVAERLDPLMAGIGAEQFVILLFHRPWGWLEAVHPRGVDLQLSGHTHGGQLFPFHLIVKWFDPFLHGRFDRDGRTLIVSRGTGTWGPPMRVLAPTEIVVVDVVPAPQATGTK